MFAVDTNVLVYAADLAAPEHEPCRALLERWRREATPWYVSWSILYEFLRVVTHPRVFRRPMAAPDAWRFLVAFLSAPSLTILVAGPRHRDVVALTLEETPSLRGNLMHDTHTAVLMREHGVRVIVTRDTDFHRFPFVEVVDPLSL